MRIKISILAFLFFFLGTRATFAANQLDVVINEVAWMGTTASANDEWIELYNTTDNSITLDEWILEAEDGTPKINLSGTINPRSYYILERTNDNTISDITADLIYSNALGNEGEKLILKSSSTVVIDQINASSGWFAGDNPTKSTMERINPLDSGDNATNWATNNGSKRNGIDESGNQINGTPKNQNSIYLTTPTPSQSLSPTPTPSSTSQATSLFTISNIPTQINSDQSFSVTVNLSQTDDPNTKFFLKGAFRHPDKPTNYFGLTKVGSTWVKNGMNATSQVQITTDQDGNWTDKIEVQPDSLDSGFIGTDDYFFKVARYNQDGENLTWSNETTIKINNITTPSNSPSPQSTPKTSPSASSTKLQSFASKPTPSLKSSYQIASVAGAQTATPEGKVETQNQKQTNPIVWVGVIFIFAGLSTLGYIYLKKNAKIHFPFRR